MNRVYLIILLTITVTITNAQSLSLQQAIDTAIATNIAVKHSAIAVEQSAINWQQAKTNLLPDLNASFNHGMNQGRSIDPFTNTYVNQKINYASYAIGSGIVLFNGMSLQSNIRQNAFAYEASRMELQQAKDDLTLNVILAYLTVLNNEDLLTMAVRQSELSQKQLERLQVLDKQGAVSPSMLADLRGQLLNDQLTINSLKNLLETSRLTLAQMMNVPYRSTVTLERINTEEFLTRYEKTNEEVYNDALQQFALIQSVGLRKKSAAYGVKALKGQLFPTLSLNGNLQTNYSSVAQNTAGKIPYDDQVRNNIFSTVNLGLRVPIFNSFRIKNRIRLAELDLKNNSLIEENTRLALKNLVDAAYLNMTSAYDRYKLALDQVTAYTESFKAAEARFNAGVGTSIDYLTAKNNLERANLTLVSSRYDFVLRKKVLDYYSSSK